MQGLLDVSGLFVPLRVKTQGIHALRAYDGFSPGYPGCRQHPLISAGNSHLLKHVCEALHPLKFLKSWPRILLARTFQVRGYSCQCPSGVPAVSCSVLQCHICVTCSVTCSVICSVICSVMLCRHEINCVVLILTNEQQHRDPLCCWQSSVGKASSSFLC